jgi:hypothetical protein
MVFPLIEVNPRGVVSKKEKVLGMEYSELLAITN